MTTQASLQDRFREWTVSQELIAPGQTTLLAVSGGMDSMAMTWLFHQAGLSFAMAHCNFSLRGEASDRDQRFVEGQAVRLGVPLFLEVFDTRAHARRHKLSIQMAARELRYHWLEEARAREGFDRVATAHHLDDAIETLLIQLGRGTGIGGLSGIPVRNGTLIRPLLFAGREEIETYVQQQEIPFREDATNAQTRYLRNKIRHHVLPPFREAFPSLTGTMRHFFQVMQQTADIYQWTIRQQASHCLIQGEKELQVLAAPLLLLPRPGVFLFEFLKDKGFSASVCRDMVNSLQGQPGKLFESPTHRAVKDRLGLIVFPKETGGRKTEPVQIGPGTGRVDDGPDTYLFDRFAMPRWESLSWPGDENTVWLDQDRLVFPLLLRPWKPGDRMHPLGASGSKKISDLLTEHKVARHRKKHIKVLVSGDKIVWVAGLRSDHEHRLRPDTRTVFACTKASGKPEKS